MFLAALLVFGVVACTEEEIGKSLAGAAFVVKTTVAIDTLANDVKAVKTRHVSADEIFLPVVKLLVRDAVKSDPGSVEKVLEVISFLKEGTADGTFVTLEDVRWAAMESLPDDSPPIWASLIDSIYDNVADLAFHRGYDNTMVQINIRVLLDIVELVVRE